MLVVEPNRGTQSVQAYIRVVDPSYLDREVRSSIDFTLKASKDNNPDEFVYEHFIINLNDTNDEDPVFDQSQYAVAVNEDLTNLNPIGGGDRLQIVQVNAIDADISDEFGTPSLR